MSIAQIPSGRFIAVQGVNPGAGRSVVALNLAFELAGHGSRVLLIDLDTDWPSLHRYFAMGSAQAAVLAACRFLEQQKLDANNLENLAVRLIAKGASINFLSGYGLNTNPDAVNLATLEALIGQLLTRFDYVVADTAANLRCDVAALASRLSDTAVAVTGPDAVSIGRFLEQQHQLPPARNRTLVVNRFRPGVLGARPEWQLQQVLRQNTNHTSAAIIPQDEAFDAALLQAVPLRQVTTKASALRAIGELAGGIVAGA